MTLKDEKSEKSRELFLNIGLDEKTVRTIVEDSDKKLTSDLIAVINQANVTDGCDRTAGNLLYKVVTEYKVLVHCPTLLEYVGSSKIKTSAQLLSANAFFKKTGTKDFKLNEFEEACGVGVEVSLEDIEKAVKQVFEENKNTILEQRYRTNTGRLTGYVLKSSPWADPETVKRVIGEKMYEMLGEKTAADNEKPTKKKEKKEKPAKVEPSEEELNPYSIFPQPEQI